MNSVPWIMKINLGKLTKMHQLQLLPSIVIIMITIIFVIIIGSITEDQLWKQHLNLSFSVALSVKPDEFKAAPPPPLFGLVVMTVHQSDSSQMALNYLLVWGSLGLFTEPQKTSWNKLGAQKFIFCRIFTYFNMWGFDMSWCIINSTSTHDAPSEGKEEGGCYSSYP